MTEVDTPLQAFKKNEADTNTQHLAEVIAALQRAGQPINVSAVARAAELDPKTVRAREDLYNEIKRHRNEQARLPKLTHATHRDAATHKDLQAKWKTAMAEVKQLRTENHALRRQLHQELSGTKPGKQPALQEAESESARLSVDLANLKAEQRELNERFSDLSVEASEAHSLNRSYTKWANRLPVEMRNRYPFEHAPSDWGP